MLVNVTSKGPVPGLRTVVEVSSACQRDPFLGQSSKSAVLAKGTRSLGQSSKSAVLANFERDPFLGQSKSAMLDVVDEGTRPNAGQSKSAVLDE